LSERSQLEERLQVLSQQLIQADRLATLGSLAGTIGHELTNITTICLGTVQLMEHRAELGLELDRSHLQTLMRAGEHLKAHSSHLQNLARPHSSDWHEIDLSGIVLDTLASLKTAGKMKYIELDAVLPDLPVIVTVSRAQVEQILINLIGNAVDALAAIPERRGFVRVRVENDVVHSRVTCKVEDNGCGIPADKLEEIFQTYFTTKPPDRGTGLGLAIAKQIASAHQGDLSVQSRLGEGSTFTLELPGVGVSIDGK
jgi:signal transduction histidine kinase